MSQPTNQEPQLDIHFPEQAPSSAQQLESLDLALSGAVTSRDLFRLSKQLAELKQRAARKQDITQAWKKWRQAVQRSQQIVSARRDNLPEISYPDLPVSARSAEIVELIRNHQVVVVAGETGSGKTTQLPKICLQAGRGINGIIGHTQPRRIAARTVASRIA